MTEETANTHVIASVSGGWSVRRTGSERAERTFGTKGEAIHYGRKVARARNSELVIHRRDGLVSERSQGTLRKNTWRASMRAKRK